MGAVLQQRTQKAWKPSAFFLKKMSTAQQKYSAYDRELLAIYEAVKLFRHMLEARHFVNFTDHKPLPYAFGQICECAPHGSLTTWTSYYKSRLTSATSPCKTMWPLTLCLAWRQSAYQSLPKL